MKIVVIGKSGQLANELQKLCAGNIISCLGRNEICITSYSDMCSVLDQYLPDAIINASAYTAVDKAETESTEAYLLNEHAVTNLAKYCAAHQIHLTHVSTDYVFGGDKGAPYLVDEPYNPQGVYGASKAAGEKVLQAICPHNSCIIRTSWVYSGHGVNFVLTMLRLMAEKPELGVIDDQIGSPTSAKALAKACLYAAQNKVPGIHHFTDSGVASWYDFAMAIQCLAIEKGMLQRAIPIKPIPTSAYPTAAKRPSYSVLDKSTLAQAFNGLQPGYWRAELSAVLDEIHGAASN
jgi:dTDP-4-dehydrorhamnose reductase